jgi:hypothetical protein
MTAEKPATVRMLALAAPFAYFDEAAGYHRHIEPDIEFDCLPEIAEELAFAGRAKLLADFEGRDKKRIGWWLVTRAHLAAAKNRRDFAARMKAA